MSENTKNEIESLGEFGLIDELTGDFEINKDSSIKGIGDDCAVISSDDNSCKLLSADMLVEGVHFNLSYMPLKSLGFKAVSVNVSDVYAMNGKPEQITVSLGISSKFPVEALKELYAGIKAACEFYSVDLIGGDTTSSYSGLIISLSVLGVADLLIVSGDLGSSYLGLQILEREKGVFNANPNIQPKLDGYDEIIKKQLQPIARRDVISMFQELSFKPTSMIDISDGLASEVLHLAKSSDCSFSIYSDKLPISEKSILTSEELGLDPYVCALNGGEDYELLFTADQKDFEKFKNNPNFSIIGFASDRSNGILLIDKNDSAVTLNAQGWRHF